MHWGAKMGLDADLVRDDTEPIIPPKIANETTRRAAYKSRVSTARAAQRGKNMTHEVDTDDMFGSTT